MSELDLQWIRSNYESMSDSDISRIASQDGAGLRPEVLEIVRAEILKRNLDPSLVNGSIAQNKHFSNEELADHAELLRDLPCPDCKSTSARLNGTITYTIKSMLFFTTYQKVLRIACPTCLDKLNEQAITTTALMGIWGIPWGVLKTPVYIYRNVKRKKENHNTEPNEALLAITANRIGEIVVAKGRKEKLIEIINSEKY